MGKQSQAHGFKWENEIKTKVFELPEESNNTDKYDVSHEKNTNKENENVSIKTTGSKNIDCSDILRFYEYDFNKKNTIILIHYKQSSDKTKKIMCIYEIDYNEEAHKTLFGTITKEELEKYVLYIKKIASGKCDEDKKKYYKAEKLRLQKLHNMKINISPKVDSKSQRRVQCSIPKFQTTMMPFIVYKSTDENNPNVIRNKEICLEIPSCPRIRKTKACNNSI